MGDFVRSWSALGFQTLPGPRLGWGREEEGRAGEEREGQSASPVPPPPTVFHCSRPCLRGQVTAMALGLLRCEACHTQAAREQKFILTALEAGGLRSGWQHGGWGGPPSGLQTSVLTVGKGRGHSLGFPSEHGTRSSGPRHLPEAPPPTTITAGGRFPHANFRGAHSDHSGPLLAPQIHVLLA